jgi:hypothetical protein
MAIFNPVDFFLEPYAEKYPFTYDDATARDLRPFLETEPLGPALESWLSIAPARVCVGSPLECRP